MVSKNSKSIVDLVSTKENLPDDIRMLKSLGEGLQSRLPRDLPLTPYIRIREP